MSYFSCHNHTYSSNIRFLDSINRPKDMIKKAIDLGFGGIAFTDHESLSAAVEIIKERDKVKKDHPDFKIIFGNEIYLIDESEVKNTNKYYHFILLAKDKEGWDQLRELSSFAWENSYVEKGQVRVPTTYQKIEEVIGKKPGHIFASTACVGGRLPFLILEHDVPGANSFIKWCIKTFGNGNFALELQPSDNEEQVIVNKTLIKLARHYNLPFIVTTDSHYLDKEDFKIHSAFLNSKQTSDRETEKFYKYTYIMTEQEMIDILTLDGHGISVDEAKEAINNTAIIGEQIQEYDFRHGTIVPRIKIPEFYTTKELYGDKRYPITNKFYNSDDEQDRYLMYQIEQGIHDKKIIMDDIKRERIEKELDILDYISERLNQKLSAYLNLTVNIINLAWQASLVAPGRGCFVPGQKVYLSNGEVKNIEDVKVGDTVITHLGKEQKVYNTLNYDCSEELYTIKPVGVPSITCTNNHEFWAVKNGKCKNTHYKNIYCNKYCKRFNKCEHQTASVAPEWVPAENLQVGDYLCVPKLKFSGIKTTTLDLLEIIPHAITIDNDHIYFKDSHSKHTGFDKNFVSSRHLLITPSLCKLVGYFIGNGWASTGNYGSPNTLGIAFHSEHTDKIKDCCELIRIIFQIEPSIIYHKSRHSCQIMVYSKKWASLFEHICGHLASNKKIPQFVFETEERAIACLQGLALTDGTFDFKDSSFKYSTINEFLQHQVASLCNALGFYCSVYTNLKRQENWETEKCVKINGKYFEKFIKKCFPERIQLIQTKKYTGTVIKEDDTYYYARVTEISKKGYTGKVYDLSVEEDTSYNINGVAVHNSSTGFYINYLIGITQIDPFVYGLKEWRFLNKERVELPKPQHWAV